MSSRQQRSHPSLSLSLSRSLSHSHSHSLVRYHSYSFAQPVFLSTLLYQTSSRLFSLSLTLSLSLSHTHTHLRSPTLRHLPTRINNPYTHTPTRTHTHTHCHEESVSNKFFFSFKKMKPSFFQQLEEGRGSSFRSKATSDGSNKKEDKNPTPIL